MTPETQALLDVISDARLFGKAQVTRAYSDAIGPDGHRVDWSAVNAAIMNRWSLTTLLAIKKAAWKQVAKRAA